VTPEVRWENSGTDVYPHIYGPLNLEAVVRVRDFPADEDGVYRKLPVW
jgi:uncharacterized protein (DUF952 family)